MSLVLILAATASTGIKQSQESSQNAANTSSTSASSESVAPHTNADTTAAETTPELTSAASTLVARVVLPPGVVPVAMASGFGSIWVADHNSPGVYRIDPATNEVSAHVQTGRESCSAGVTVVVDEVWQSTCGVGSFIRIDPQTNQVIGEVTGFYGVASFNGEIWATDAATSPGVLVLLDPSAHTTVESISVGAGPGYLAVDQQSVWVVNHDDRTVSRIDKASRKVVATIPLGEPSLFGGGAIAIAGGAVWVAHLDDGSVYRVDPKTNTAERIFLEIERSGHYWEQYLHGSENGVWVRVRDGLIVQLSPETGRPIGGYPVDPGGGDMEFAFGSLWVNGINGVQRFTIA